MRLKGAIIDYRGEVTIRKYAALLEATIMASDERPSAGLSFQISDVFLPELLGLLKEQGSNIPDQPLQQLLDIFLNVMATTTRFSLVQRIRQAERCLVGNSFSSLGDRLHGVVIQSCVVLQDGCFRATAC